MPRTFTYPPVYNFSADEIVDDSEPERAELRKQGRRATSQRNRCSTNVDSEVEIISTAPPRLNAHVPQNRSVIELSDSDTEDKIVPFGLKCPNTENIISPTKLVCQRPVTNAEASTSKSQPPSLSQSSSPTAPKRLDLNRFAFKNPPIRKNSTPPARGIATSTLTTLAADIDRPISKSSKVLNIPSADLAKIFRCISCDLSWTARKTAVQKMAHIKSCAKKNNFTDDIIQFLIRRELACIAPVEKQTKGKQRHIVSKVSSKNDVTYMDGILDDSGPRKKDKRQQTQTVLANVSTTRDSILERAKTILGTTTNDDINSVAHSTPKHLIKCVNESDESLLLATQTFRQSTLAQQQDARSTTLFSAIYASPPSPIIDISSDTSLTYISPNHVPPSPPEVHSQAIPRIEHRCDSVQSIGGPSNVTISDSLITRHLLLTANKHTSQDDDTHGIIPLPLPSTPSTPIKKARKSKAKSSKNLSDASEDDWSGIDVKSTPTKRSRCKPPLKKAAIVHAFDEKWELHMIESIHQDPNLYLRMLRYEPIDFNVFLEIAQRYAPCSAKLKRHLRAYLDKRAIHFYDASRV